MTSESALFPLGWIVATPGAIEAMIMSMDEIDKTAVDTVSGATPDPYPEAGVDPQKSDGWTRQCLECGAQTNFKGVFGRAFGDGWEHAFARYECVRCLRNKAVHVEALPCKPGVRPDLLERDVREEYDRGIVWARGEDYVTDPEYLKARDGLMTWFCYTDALRAGTAPADPDLVHYRAAVEGRCKWDQLLAKLMDEASGRATTPDEGNPHARPIDAHGT